MTDEYYDFCIASPWNFGKGLNVYTYGQQVHRGTKKGMESFLKYVKEQEPTKKWDIYILKKYD